MLMLTRAILLPFYKLEQISTIGVDPSIKVRFSQVACAIATEFGVAAGGLMGESQDWE